MCTNKNEFIHQVSITIKTDFFWTKNIFKLMEFLNLEAHNKLFNETLQLYEAHLVLKIMVNNC